MQKHISYKSMITMNDEWDDSLPQKIIKKLIDFKVIGH